MKVKQFYSTGNRDILEGTYIVPPLGDNEVRVKTKYTGVCFSDHEWFEGKFDVFGYNSDFFGHEGVGEVIDVGDDVTHVKVGDMVATWRSSPAFAEVYNARYYVQVPKNATQSHILEPVACGINVALKAFEAFNATIKDCYSETPDIVIFGTGFLSTIVYMEAKKQKLLSPERSISVVGRGNREFWESEGVTQYESLYGVPKFKHIIDLSDKPEYLTSDVVEEGAIYVYAANKLVNDFSKLLNKGATVIMPSPSSDTFVDAMSEAAYDFKKLNSNGIIDALWQFAYNANIDDVTKAFTDSKIDKPGRRYIKWF